MTGFKWIIIDKLAGSGRPGLYKDAQEDILFINEMGFDVVVTLTEDPLEEDFEGQDFELIHFPIADMYIPRLAPTIELCRDLKEKIDAGNNILVHCKAGLGRTGTIQACILIEMGHTAEEAIVEVRKKNNWAIQNTIQEKFIEDYWRITKEKIQK